MQQTARNFGLDEGTVQKLCSSFYLPVTNGVKITYNKVVAWIAFSTHSPTLA